MPEPSQRQPAPVGKTGLCPSPLKDSRRLNVVSALQALALLDAACRQARTGAHNMNARSSRSFVDFILKVLGALTLAV